MGLPILTSLCAVSRSARQAKRLAKECEAEIHATSDEEVDEDEQQEEKRAASVGFAFLADSESDENDSDSNQENDRDEVTDQPKEDVEKPVVVASKPFKGKKK